MRPLRRRKLSTFLIPTPAALSCTSSCSASLCGTPRADTRLGISSVHYRNVLDIGLSPRLPRSTADLRLHDLRKYGWSWPNPDPSRLVFSREGGKRIHSSGKLGIVRSNTNMPVPQTVGINVKDIKDAQYENLLTSRSLPPISSHGVTMLRRPTVDKTKPVSEEGPMFQMIIKGRELKPYSFQGNDAKSDEFYAQNFPLLCQKLTDDSVPTSAVTNQVVEEKLRMPSGRRRARDMRQRMWRLEESLTWMEAEAKGEGETMDTELRDLTFDPTAWPWNKQRYDSPKECQT